MRFRRIQKGSWWRSEELCEVPRCLLGRGLRYHCPLYNVSCILYLLQQMSPFLTVHGWIVSGQASYTHNNRKNFQTIKPNKSCHTHTHTQSKSKVKGKKKTLFEGWLKGTKTDWKQTWRGFLGSHGDRDTGHMVCPRVGPEWLMHFHVSLTLKC